MSDQYDGPELARQVRMLREENERLRLHIDKRAAGVDPLTQQLRERAERAEAELADERKRHDENLVLWKQADAERNALRADAERYRVLRDAHSATKPFCVFSNVGKPLRYEELDAATDAAMRGKEQGNG